MSDKFKLKSDYKPTGDQPKAIKDLSDGLKKNYDYQTLLGVTGSGKTFSMANVIENVNKPTLVLSHNKTLAAQLAQEFRNFFPENAVHYFISYYDYYQPESYLPSTDTYIAKETQINEEIDRLRHAATSSLLSRKDVIIVASVSCIYGLGTPESYSDHRLQFKVGQKYNRDDILRQLIEINFSRNNLDPRQGNFRVQGDIIQIFPTYSESYLQFEFFGDELESISETNPFTKLKTKKYDQMDIYPASHFTTFKDFASEIIPKIKTELKDRQKYLKSKNKLLEYQRITERTNYDLEMLKETGYCSGIENYSRYLDGREPGQTPYTLFDYFPKDFLFFVDESHITLPQVRGMYAGDRARKETLIDFGFRLPSALDNRPLNFDEFESKINQAIFVSATPESLEKEKSKQIVEQLIRPTGLLDPTVEIKPTKNQVDDLLEQIQQRIKNKQRVLVTTLTKKLSEELTEFLKNLNIKVAYLHSDIDSLERIDILRDLRLGKYDVLVGINLLREGLDLPEVSLVAILDADKEGFLRSKTSLIQTMGRAARHVEGHVIMYADHETKSMKSAISETQRRRQIQDKYNKEHGITPKSITKEIAKNEFQTSKRGKKSTLPKITPGNIDQLPNLIESLKTKMDLAASNLEFEQAAVIRDQVAELEKVLKESDNFSK